MSVSLSISNERVLYVDCITRSAGLLVKLINLPSKGNASFHIDAPAMVESRNISSTVKSHEVNGVIFHISRGWPNRTEIIQAYRFLRHAAVWFYWPHDEVIERLDRKILREYIKLWCAVKAFALYKRIRKKPWAAPASIPGSVGDNQGSVQVVNPAEIEAELRHLVRCAKPVVLSGIEVVDGKVHVKGKGVYLRTDFWSQIKSGGSYGHTCYVAKELKARTDEFVCYMANKFELLDEFHIEQKVFPKPSETCNELDVLKGTNHYYDLLYESLLKEKPAYIYERYCVGNYAAAKLSKDLGIPYILEYNGSEISMKKSFDARGYEYEDIYRLGELFVFQQATAITVVSKIIADCLIKDGVDQRKILVNPNACSPEDYRPPEKSHRKYLRSQYKWSDKNLVIGFIGTFGGWHGIDVIAKALPIICKKLPEARFLLIGDGNFKNLVTEAVDKHNLHKEVVLTGTVPQQEGAKLLGLCDILVSPHSSNMVDSRFFGSPTKLFEYMSMGQGIVASDLEQIGEVLTPNLKVKDLLSSGQKLKGNELAVVCKPGDVDEFVEGVVYLARNPEQRKLLGRNARNKVLENHTWSNHVKTLLRFLENIGSKNNHREESARGLLDVHADLLSIDMTKKDFYESSIKKVHEEERSRYELDAPWIPKVIDFKSYRDKKVLVIGCGTGIDVARFASNGAKVIGVTCSEEIASRARLNLEILKLDGEVISGVFESLPFDDNSFDMVFSIGILEQSHNPVKIADEIYRVLKPMGEAITVGHSRHSIRYWKDVVLNIGLRKNYIAYTSPISLLRYSYPIIARETEMIPHSDVHIKLYDRKQLERIFGDFKSLSLKKQFSGVNRKPHIFKLVPNYLLNRFLGWIYVMKAQKPSAEASGQ